MQAKFMTGIYGAFNRAKTTREMRPGFHGFEVSCLQGTGEAKEVTDYACGNGLAMGVHFPLIRDAYPAVGLHPWLTSRDEHIRRAGFEAINRDLDAANAIGAEYLVVHYPKPAVIDCNLSWIDWRFVQQGEAIDERTTSPAEQEDLSLAAFDRLSQLASQSRVRLAIEHDVLNFMHYGPLNGGAALLPRLFRQHPDLGLCVDTGRLHLLESTDTDFDALGFTSLMLPYITNVHLWTAKLGTNRFGGHHPLHPNLKEADGWGNMRGLLQILASLGNAYVMFEHRADLITAKQLDECYSWVATELSATCGIR